MGKSFEVNYVSAAYSRLLNAVNGEVFRLSGIFVFLHS